MPQLKGGKMNLILLSIAVFFMGIGGFYVACYLIRLWTGCNEAEAIAKLHDFINGKAETVKPSLYNDRGFYEAIESNIRNVIGEKRFEQLVRLSYTAIQAPMIGFWKKGGVSCITISTYYRDNVEKTILKEVLSNVVREYLQIYGLDCLIMAEWKVRDDLNMPYLEIRYAETPEEMRALSIYLQKEQRSIIARNNPITDETENEELDE